MEHATALCRDCLTAWSGAGRCPSCRSPRALRHAELGALAIAHVDCDAFYASVEKRDNPELRDVPLIVGGGSRGVVTTACYLARIRGVKSAMPMFQARKLCPQAVIVKPRMAHYVAVSREIRAMQEELTPLVEQLSLDEAFLDLSGTERLHGMPPAALLVRLQNRIEAEIGVTVSVGLSHNKFLAKIASDLDKPRGFAVIGRAETRDFLARQPIGVLWGVGSATRRALEADGIRTIGDLRLRERKYLIERFGALGDRLWHLGFGEDHRRVMPEHKLKSISNETTFFEDITDIPSLESHLWRLTEKVAMRAKAKGLGGRTVVLKLKHSDHRLLTRRHSLDEPTQMANRIFPVAQKLLLQCSNLNFSFRLIGLGLSNLTAADDSDRLSGLIDPDDARLCASETLADQIRARFGDKSIMFGRSFR
ncbi:DNA polymerase IV [Rhodobacteraceae bacterium DSL-40]|uniref:DNA polymerase IV n=1 Tax=Amaricoccus sp. B4 TaxID=3368557 RepID=UPI000DAD3979